MRNKLKITADTILLKVPEDVKYAFEMEAFRENYSRLKYFCITLLFLEIVIYLLRNSFFDTGITLPAFILFSAMISPVIWYCSRNLFRLNRFIILAVQYVYAFAILFFGIGLTFVTQKSFDLVHMYFMMIFGVSFFLFIKPLHSLLILFFGYAVFALLLPFFQDSPEAVFVMRINALAVNVFSLIVSRFWYMIRLKMFLDNKTIQEKNKALEELVRLDSMTKLFNHGTATQLLAEEIRRCGKKDPLSIVIADIDRFKQINDKYGHLTGDYVIKKVAETIKGVIRSNDYACRYGGDEFLIIMPGTGIEPAVSCVERMQAAIKKVDFENIDTTPTISGGVCEYKGETLEELIALADKKLYRAKRAGRNVFK